VSVKGIFVDSSVWIDFFADKDLPHVDRLDRTITHWPLVLGDVVITEVLQGARNEHEANHLLTRLRERCRVQSVVDETNAISAAALFRKMRARGVTIRKTVDLWIAVWCIRNRVPILHNDRDFTRIAEHGMGLTIYS
jgi:hypothetical protein